MKNSCNLPDITLFSINNSSHQLIRSIHYSTRQFESISVTFLFVLVNLRYKTFRSRAGRRTPSRGSKIFPQSAIFHPIKQSHPTAHAYPSEDNLPKRRGNRGKVHSRSEAIPHLRQMNLQGASSLHVRIIVLYVMRSEQKSFEKQL